jgi:ribosomal protein S18 acetylase RimI-like enzyme
MAIIPAHTAQHFLTIETLAREIVPDFYEHFFARATAEYLVEHGHTAKALEEQVVNGGRHFLIGFEGVMVGYFSLQQMEGGLLLSHFYVMAAYRGKGLGKEVMAFIGQEALATGVEKIELFVLRRNKAAVGLYKKYGFFCAAEVMTRLGNGAVLDDYLMRKIVEN